MNTVASLCGEALTEEKLWELLIQNQNKTYRTVKRLEFCYSIKGYEMFIDRKDKSITYSTVMLAYKNARILMETVGAVTGPKKLGTFGASYLYPVFLEIGVICGQEKERKP